MSTNKTHVLEGPDGRLYEIPLDRLAEFVVPPQKVKELRMRISKTMNAATPPPDIDGTPPPPPDGHARLGELPPSHPGWLQQQAIMAALAAERARAAEGYHMSFDENGIPISHTDMLWGDYIDKQGNPAVGFHSHDPVSGNAS
jgi:hypothetical protein